MSEDKAKHYDILAIGAHPDDVEVGCGGLFAKSAAQGHSVCCAILTEGEMGTGGDIETRRRESQAAARIMGADLLHTFDWGDTQLFDTYEHRKELAALIRRAAPRIVICPYPHASHGRRGGHPDHVAAGEITINAVMLAALKKFESDAPAHHVERIFYHFLPPEVKPSFVVDITEYYDKWLDALKAHASQFQNPQKQLDYIFYLETTARSAGQLGRCKYGQAFYAVEPLLVEDLMDLVKAQSSDREKADGLRANNS